MKVNAIAITPPDTAHDVRRATPELLASSLAKYSRSMDGIDSILDSIDWNDQDKSIDNIFKFIDYGHASIGGMTGGIAITVDDCSMYLAYKIFELSNLVDGQESSTRYIKLKKDTLIDPTDAGIPEEFHDKWLSMMGESFDLYNKKYDELEAAIESNPDLITYPEGASDKVKTRLRKNYALDRARYLIPFATKTSAAYIMNARTWADVLKRLQSIPVKECAVAAKAIRRELMKMAPRLVKHSFPDEASIIHARREVTLPVVPIVHIGISVNTLEDKVWVKVDDDTSPFMNKLDDYGFDGKINRYSDVSSNIKRTFTRFSINNIALAELRDLNRHRTGYKYTDMVPVGFYLPPELRNDNEIDEFLHKWSLFMQDVNAYNDTYDRPTYMYSYLLGVQVAFEHSTQLDKLVYEIELRTGMGAHFRYAEHLKAISDALCQIRPQYESFIIIGDAEPE